MKAFSFFAILFLAIGCTEKENDDTNDTNEDNSDTENPPDDIYMHYEDVFTSHAGCADFFLFSQNDDDTIALQIRGDGIAESAYEAGEPKTFTFDLASTEVSLKVIHGTNINAASCNDAIDGDIIIEETKVYDVINGTLTLTVTPTANEPMGIEFPADVEVTLQSSDFCANDSVEDCLHIEELNYTARIGWMPG